VTQVYSSCSQGHCDNENCLSTAGRSRAVSRVEFVLRLGNNLLEGSILGYYFGDVIRNSTVANVIQYFLNFVERGRAINLNFNIDN